MAGPGPDGWAVQDKVQVRIGGGDAWHDGLVYKSAKRLSVVRLRRGEGQRRVRCVQPIGQKFRMSVLRKDAATLLRVWQPSQKATCAAVAAVVCAVAAAGQKRAPAVNIKRKLACSDVIDLCDEEDEEAEVHREAEALAHAFINDKQAPGWKPPPTPPIRVASLRMWKGTGKGPLYQRGAAGYVFTPPEIEQMCAQLPNEKVLSIGLWYQRTTGPAGPALVVAPGGEAENFVIPLSSLAQGCAEASGDAVYIRFATTNTNIHRLEKVCVDAMVAARVRKKQGNRGALPPDVTALGAELAVTPEAGNRNHTVLHVAMLCRCNAATTRSGQVASLAQFYMLKWGMEVLKAPCDGRAELGWMQKSVRSLSGRDDTLCAYAEPTAANRLPVVTVQDYRRLKRGRFLSGAMINYAFLKVLQPKSPQHAFFSTHFLGQLIHVVRQAMAPGPGHKDRQAACFRWIMSPALPAVITGAGGKQRSLASFKRLFIPVHHQAKQHWSLGIVELPDPAAPKSRGIMVHCDSLHGDDEQQFCKFIRFFVHHRLRLEGDGAAKKIYQRFQAKDATVLEKGTVVPPKQTNMYDCGVHVIVMAMKAVEPEWQPRAKQPFQYDAAMVEQQTRRVLQEAVAKDVKECGNPEVLRILDRANAAM
eukprot:TRINITY_DN19914_c0_g1_i1.p1 TRINITY_DN19914_c0_g1~~TRINITY_DN19914_c0_g1_i1.p1  ORF type:complete len:645 (+),score=173.13 TRINITY_DN19914_c0_g1_i1:115-2049(+)